MKLPAVRVERVARDLEMARQARSLAFQERAQPALGPNVRNRQFPPTVNSIHETPVESAHSYQTLDFQSLEILPRKVPIVALPELALELARGTIFRTRFQSLEKGGGSVMTS